MKLTYKTAIFAALLVIAVAVMALANGYVPPMGAGPTVTLAPGTRAQVACPNEQWITATVAQAWQMTGRNYNAFRDVVSRMTDMSARNRGVTVPDTREAGTEIGEMIRQRAEADPNALLYAVVDSAVVDYARNHQTPR